MWLWYTSWAVGPLDRAQVIKRLRELAGEHELVTTAVVRPDRPLFRGVRAHFDSLADARQAAGVSARRPRKWSKAQILDELQRLHRNGASTTGRDLIEAGRGDLRYAVHEQFGSLRRAHQLAGIAMQRAPGSGPWDKLRVLATIIELRRKGQSLAASRVPQPLVSAGVKCFGSWRTAVEASGADYQSERLHRAPYTKAEIIQTLRDLARTRPQLTTPELWHHPAVSAMCRLFGSLEGAIAAAGIKHWPVRTHESWDRARVIKELREHARRRPGRLDPRLLGACANYFGSVGAARVAAGVSPLRRADWTKPALLEELRDRARRGDTGADLRKQACRLFGSLPNARRLAGVAAPRPWTPQRVLEELRGLDREGGPPIPPSLHNACKYYFGSIEAACRAARVRWLFRPPIAQWSKPQLLEELRKRVAAGREISSSLAVACRTRFGSLQKARRAAGLPTRSRTGARARR